MKSLLHKLLLSSWLIILLPMGLAIFWTSQTLSDLLERRFTEKSRAQAQHVELLLNEKKETTTGLVHWIAEMPGVRENLQRENRDALFQHLLPVVGSIEMDFIEILDADGRIFLRVHDPSRFGDRPALAPDVQEILQGKQDFVSYGIEERDGKAYLRAAESIQGDRIAGIVSVGYALGPDFIKKLQLISGGQVVVALGDRVYTDRGPGAKPPGTAPASVAGAEAHWHRASPAKLEIRIPLERTGQEPGVLSLFFPSQELTSAIGTLQRTLFSVALVGMLLAFSVSWLLSRRLTKPLKELARRTEQVAAGDYHGTVQTAARDEIGTLADSFNRMVQELARSKAEVDRYRQELERKFVETGKELAETEKKRAAMAHMIAHDLKNPLLGIKKTLERLQRPSPPNGEEPSGRLMSDLLSASNLVMGMVNEMLDLYRSDFGDLPLSVNRFAVEEAVDDSRRVLRPELEEKKLRLECLFQPPGIALVGDRRRLTRLLTNLLSNAVKFSPDRGQIRISASRLDDDENTGSVLLLRIEDEGSGMAEEELPRLFERFYSRDGKNGEMGTGLGLPYCRLVAEAHRGRIFAENRQGGGFVVSVLLPIADAQVETTHAIEGFDRR